MKPLPLAALLLLLFFSALADERPNILFLFADDHAYNTVGALGNDEIHTPNLDKLAQRGTTFTHAYNMGGWNGAICVASRTMLNTGKYLWHANRTDLKKMQADGQLWSQLLNAAGYDTFFTGKWHVKADPKKIFTRAKNIRGGMPNQTREGYNRPKDGEPDPWSPYDPKFEGFWKGGTHWSEVVKNDTLSFLDQAKASENPFFMYIAFNAPHDPRQAPKKYVDMYPLENVAVPQPFLAEYPHNAVMGSGRGLRDEKLAPFPRTPNAVKVNRQEYYAIISHMDTQIGLILDALEKSGEADNTWIFFSADHGLGCGHHGLLGKQNQYDHSVRVPFFVAGPGIAAGKEISTPIYYQDIMPTSLALAEAPQPDWVQFESLLPLIHGETTEGRDAIYGGFTATQRMITMDSHKLILYPKGNIERLFDLKADPREQKDIANQPGSKQIITRLKNRLLELQKENGDTLDLATGKFVGPEPAPKFKVKQQPKAKQ